MLHTDSYSGLCELNATVGAVFSEDNFGVHGNINPKFRCTQADNSTTQWWFGAHLKKQSQNEKLVIKINNNNKNIYNNNDDDDNDNDNGDHSDNNNYNDNGNDNNLFNHG